MERSGVVAKGLVSATLPKPDPTNAVVPRKIVVRVSVQKKKARIFFGSGSGDADLIEKNKSGNTYFDIIKIERFRVFELRYLISAFLMPVYQQIVTRS
jgi:hypothetical protein